MGRSMYLRKHDTTCYELDKWYKENDLTLEELQEAVSSLIRRAEFQRGYEKAEDDRRRELVAQAHRDRNGGKDPDFHNCHFCGEYVANGYDVAGARHWLSDCRPDLVEHEPDPDKCSWWYKKDRESEGPYCYAFQKREGLPYSKWEWTDEHIHFDEDGPL